MLQSSPHSRTSYLTSQYFFRHADFLHLQPILWTFCEDFLPWEPSRLNLFWNALEFLARVSLIAFSRTSPDSGVLPQSLQLHPWQKRSAAKHSQYNLRHRDFLQLQGLLLETPFFLLFSLPSGGGILRRCWDIGLASREWGWAIYIGLCAPPIE